MCSSISWEQFILTIVVIVGLYYGYVGVSYYRKDWLYRLSGKKSPGSSFQPVVPSPAMATGVAAANPLLPVVHDVVDEIRALLQAEGSAANKENLLDKLRRLLQKYPTLRNTAFQPSINQLLAIDCKNHCSMDLDENEIRALWKE
jgi:hypothetical protein